MNEKKFCPHCQDEGKKSEIYEGMGTTTLMAITPGYYDKEGDYHPPYNPNRTTIEWSCSEGHRWLESS